MIELSVVIPNYNSPFTSKTIQGILDNAGCEVEVIVNVEDKWPEPLIEDERVHYIHGSAPIGMRAGINKCVALSKGKYIMKLDDHCMVGKNFGRILIESHQPDWVQVPQRYALNAEEWKIEERTDDKYPICQMYQDFPRKGKASDDGTHGVEWRQRRNETQDQDLVESPSMQGSCWFMTKERFFELGGFPLTDPYGHGQEPLWIALRNWLMGGKVMVNKNTWYAHLHQNSSERGYPEDKAHTERTYNEVAKHFVENKGHYTHSFEWFVDKFYPMPSWPENWRELL